MALTLIIGNKNYSSWSFRPWIAMKTANIPFKEEVIPLGTLDFRARVDKLSPAGKVPLLLDGDIVVWESLSILEYLADKFPKAGLWPTEPSARAQARNVATEMHGGFAPLRNHCPMNFWRPVKKRDLTPEATANAKRIDAMWSDCRARFGNAGRFLFGPFTAVDAMYAPVVSRFHTYAIPVSATSRAYMDAVMALPAWAEWKGAAVKEPWQLAEDEVDWPTVLRA